MITVPSWFPADISEAESPRSANGIHSNSICQHEGNHEPWLSPQQTRITITPVLPKYCAASGVNPEHSADDSSAKTATGCPPTRVAM